jgi:hypothetical protein
VRQLWSRRLSRDLGWKTDSSASFAVYYEVSRLGNRIVRSIFGGDCSRAIVSETLWYCLVAGCTRRNDCGFVRRSDFTRFVCSRNPKLDLRSKQKDGLHQIAPVSAPRRTRLPVRGKQRKVINRLLAPSKAVSPFYLRLKGGIELCHRTPNHVKIDCTTLPDTSVSRKSRPWNLNVRRL